MNTPMNANEMVNLLRARAETQNKRGYSGEASEWLELADLIESLQAELTTSQRMAQDARNELCLKCGRYREAHNGACDGCRWKED
jgi:uncharacterized protein YlxW (UPF0749 family)